MITFDFKTWVIALLCCSIPSVSVRAQAQPVAPLNPLRSAYWHFKENSKKYNLPAGQDLSNYKYKNWMTKLDERLLLTQLNIPGTHGSAAYGPNFSLIPEIDKAARCHTMDLQTQLAAGARFFDLRGRRVRNSDGSFSYTLHHTAIYLNKNLDDELLKMQVFLRENPKETILLLFRPNEKTPNYDVTKYPDQTPARILKNYRDRYPGLFWNATKNNPSLKDVRGKIVMLLQYFPFDENDKKNYPNWDSWGVRWDADNGKGYVKGGILPLVVQDNWSMNYSSGLYAKWTSIKIQADKAKVGNTNTLYVNYLSAAGNFVRPWYPASGQKNQENSSPFDYEDKKEALGGKTWDVDWPRQCGNVGITGTYCRIYHIGNNTMAAYYFGSLIKKYEENGKRGTPPHTGVVLADFPGYLLYESIIKMNDYLKPNSP